MDEDPNGEDLVDEFANDEGMRKFLEDVLGNEKDVLDEFKSSDVFEEFLKEFSFNPNSTSISRRPSLGSDKEENNDDKVIHKLEENAINEEEQRDAIPLNDFFIVSKKSEDNVRKQRSTDNSNENIIASGSRKIGVNEKGSPCQKSNRDEKEKKIREKLKICLKLPGTSKKDKKLLICSKQDKNTKPSSHVGASNATILAADLAKNTELDTASSYSDLRNDLIKTNLQPVQPPRTSLNSIQEVRIQLYNLLLMTKLFPREIQSPVMLSSEMLEDIKLYERKAKSSVSPKKTHKNSIRIPPVVSSHQRHPSREEHKSVLDPTKLSPPNKFASETPVKKSISFEIQEKTPRAHSPLHAEEKLSSMEKLPLEINNQVKEVQSVSPIKFNTTETSPLVILNSDSPDKSLRAHEKVAYPSEAQGTSETTNKRPDEVQSDKKLDENAPQLLQDTPVMLQRPTSPNSAAEESKSPSSDCMTYEKHSPDIPSDEQNVADSVIPSKKNKSPTPERSNSRKKKIIDSSSDDGDMRKDDTDTTATSERKNSDEEHQKGGSKTLPFERKREQVDSRIKKFDKFEHERQRKLGEIKKGKVKPKENYALVEVFKEKPLTPSFRIPKRTTINKKHDSAFLITPLVVHDMPKENLQFERCRKGQDKDKDNYNDFRGFRQRHDRERREPDAFARNRDDGRRVTIKEATPPGEAVLEPEPAWDDEPDTGGCDDDNHATDVKKDDAHAVDIIPEDNYTVDKGDDDHTVDKKCDDDHSVDIKRDDDHDHTVDSKSVDDTIKVVETRKETKDNVCKPENEDESELAVWNPDVPLVEITVNSLSVGVITLMHSKKCEMPDIDEITNLFDITVMKLAWWLVNADFESSDAGNSPDADGASNCSFLDNLNITDSEDEDFSQGFSARINDPVDELCGRSLLQAQYRCGPGDSFKSIFQIRSGASYEKERFQARCTICNKLVVGKIDLAVHILSEKHMKKMSTAGLDNLKSTEGESSSDRKAVDKKEKVVTRVERDKKPERSEKTDKKDEYSSKKRETSEANNKSKEKNVETGINAKETDKKKNEVKEVEKRPEKRKRSNERSPNGKSRESGGVEIGRTSTGLLLKIPAGAVPERKSSESRGRNSRSKSPRQKRTRSRSPHAQSRSPKRKSRSRSPRRHKRGHTPIHRIPRSPTRIREQRRRSTSTERVEKFLARTNRRSRSPSNGYSRKRHRRSRSKSPSAQMPLKRDNREFHEKLALTAAGKWTNEMEQRWKLMEAEEAIFMEKFGETRAALIEVPENHPKYGDEWTEFWEQRYQELEKQGADPDKHDFVSEWKEFWSKRLKVLLELEYENGIKEIKRRNGMDFDTLQKLQIAQEALIKSVATVPTPQPVLPPQPVPPPQPVSYPGQVLPPEPVTASTKPMESRTESSISSKSLSDAGEGLTARSTTFSDNGLRVRDKVQKDVNTVPLPKSSSSSATTQPAVTVTAGDIMSTWERLKSGGVTSRQSSGLGVTLSPANSLPFGRTVGEKTDTEADSGSCASYDFDGFDLVQVLRLMSNLEDQLSFLAPKVREYFTMAEEMELKKRNKSYQLLKDEDFVVMLFHVRDRFMAMIRANILPKDVLKSLNLTVYALNAILDSNECQKHRSKFASSSAALEADRQGARLKETSTESTKKSVEVKTTHPTFTSEQVFQAISKFPTVHKQKISQVLASFVLSMGREDMTDKELKDFVWKMLAPSMPKTSNDAQSWRSSVASASGTVQQNAISTSDSNSGAAVSLTNEKDLWRVPISSISKTFSVASARRVGTAAPLPPIMMSGGPERGSLSSSESGRRSPFSKRDFTGNPSAASFYDKDEFGSKTHSTCKETQYFHTSLHRKTKFKQNLFDLRQHLEITMDQLTKSKTHEIIQPEQPIDNFECHGPTQPVESLDDPPRLPPGILNFIMQERKTKEYTRNEPSRVDMKGSEQGEIVSEDDERGYRRPERHKKKRRKRKRKKYHHTDSSSSSDNKETLARSTRRDHKKRKKKKDENRQKGSSPISENSNKSDAVNFGTIRRAPPLYDSACEIIQRSVTPNEAPYNKSLLRETNTQPTLVYSAQPEITSPYVSPPLSIGSQLNREDEHIYHSSRVHVQDSAPNSKSDWGSVSEKSFETERNAKGQSVKQRSGSSGIFKKSLKQTNANPKAKIVKVTAVAHTFWSSKDDDRSICSISTNESIGIQNQDQNPERQPAQTAGKIRQYRASHEENEKEPGELSSDSDGK